MFNNRIGWRGGGNFASTTKNSSQFSVDSSKEKLLSHNLKNKAMSKFKRFEEIEAWKRTRSLSTAIYKLTSTPDFQKDFSLVNQIRRASGSIMDNIAEGFGREGNREFQQFLTIAKGSAFEVKSQLYRALDQQYILIAEFEEIYIQADTICKLITGLLKYIRNSEYRGTKFKELSKTDDKQNIILQTEPKTEN